MCTYTITDRVIISVISEAAQQLSSRNNVLLNLIKAGIMLPVVNGVVTPSSGKYHDRPYFSSFKYPLELANLMHKLAEATKSVES